MFNGLLRTFRKFIINIDKKSLWTTKVKVLRHFVFYSRSSVVAINNNRRQKNIIIIKWNVCMLIERPLKQIESYYILTQWFLNCFHAIHPRVFIPRLHSSVTFFFKIIFIYNSLLGIFFLLKPTFTYLFSIYFIRGFYDSKSM